MLGLANAFANKNDQTNGCGMLRTCCPLLSSKDILIAQQSLNGGQEPHGYTHSFRQPQRAPMGPVHSPPPIQAMSSYPSLPIPVMPQMQPQMPPQLAQPAYPMLASNVQYGSNVYQMPANQVNFNRQPNRKSLERNPTYDYSNNFQSKASYSHLFKQFGQSTVYPGKCGIKPTQFNQARIQNLHYPASSTEFGKQSYCSIQIGALLANYKLLAFF